MRSVELFAGAGGLALGCELAGFESQLVVEWDRWACDTMRQNKAHGYPLVSGWNVHEGDVRAVDWSHLVGTDIDLVAGGPPCQPFSMGGKHGAYDDARDMFPAATEVIRTLRPRAFLLENVKGLTRSAFTNYFSYIQFRLSMPEVTRRDDELWTEHLARLQAEHTSTADSGLSYRVVPTLVNAADYGVPQQRHRVFLVGIRSDIDAEFRFPTPTHTRAALLRTQASGEYWDRHGIPTSKRPAIVAPRWLDEGEDKPWRTVRDALVGLPAPTARGTRSVLNHVQQLGARSYPGHTGSPADEPAKTLKAGDHGVPGGENMLRNLDGAVRYFTVRESARLQTFPERYELHGSWTEAMRQLGNAVPVLLAEKVAKSVAAHLAAAEVRKLHSKAVQRWASA